MTYMVGKPLDAPLVFVSYSIVLIMVTISDMLMLAICSCWIH